mgnify:CR=1 FL=1
MNDVEIRALVPFNKTVRGDICEPGDVFTVDATRADELVRMRLAERVEKAAPKPANKMKPATSNKGG